MLHTFTHRRLATGNLLQKIVHLLLLLLCASSYAQNSKYTPKAAQKDNKDLQEITDAIYGNGWLKMKESKKLNSKLLFALHKKAFGLSASDEMILQKVEEIDSISQVLHRFQQYYKGIKVEGGEFVVKARNASAATAHGKIIEDLDLLTQAALSPEQALQKALTQLKAQRYIWEPWSDTLSSRTKDSLAALKPKGELIITPLLYNGNLHKSNFKLAYAFSIGIEKPAFDIRRVYVDAATGAVLKNFTQIRKCDGGSVDTYYDGSDRGVKIRKRGFPNFDSVLEDDCHNINTERWDNSGFNPGYRRIRNNNTDWGNSMEATAHWGVQVTHDYFRFRHNRRGTDGNNRFMRVGFNRLNIACNAAYVFDPFLGIDNEIWIGTGGTTCGQSLTCNPMVSLDILAHEFTHGVTTFTSDLTFFGESGALNESFSDIFGTVVEYYYHGYDLGRLFTIGEGPIAGGLRSMSDPNSIPVTFEEDCTVVENWAGSPTFYQQSGFWYTGFRDNGGVHVNSGVQNNWFYLLTQGGNRFGVTVSPIDINSAARIAYLNLITLNAGSQYQDAANGSVQAAIDLFGLWCSPVVGLKTRRVKV